MALSKLKILNNGSSGNYWKIVFLSINKSTMDVSCSLSLYLDKAHADINAPLEYHRSFSFIVQREELNEDVIALIYSKIKERVNGDSPDADLAGAQDA